MRIFLQKYLKKTGLTWLLLVGALVAKEPTENFSRFPAGPVSTNKLAKVDWDSHPKAKTYRTRLGELVGSKADFAGHYKVLEVGAGTMATRVFLVDVDTGRVYLAPFIASLGVKYSVESRLMLENDPQAVRDYARDFPGGQPDWLKTRPWRWNEDWKRLVPLNEQP